MPGHSNSINRFIRIYTLNISKWHTLKIDKIHTHANHHNYCNSKPNRIFSNSILKQKRPSVRTILTKKSNKLAYKNVIKSSGTN